MSITAPHPTAPSVDVDDVVLALTSWVRDESLAPEEDKPEVLAGLIRPFAGNATTQDAIELLHHLDVRETADAGTDRFEHVAGEFRWVAREDADHSLRVLAAEVAAR